MNPILPLSHDDKKTVEDVCANNSWSQYQTDWIQALSHYKAEGGDPWLVKPSGSLSAIKKELIALYESRRKSGHIEKIRNLRTGKCCPFCGSLGDVGTVDHYLPKDVYPEFSVYSLNLIPACSFCNSHEKKTKFIGASPPCRFIHPYFDGFLSGPVWIVRISKPYDAAVIGAEPVDGLGKDELAVVRFHLDNVLGKSFFSRMGHLWASLPLNVVIFHKGNVAELKPIDVRGHVETMLLFSCQSNGVNSWDAGFYRGVLADSDVVDYMAKKIVDESVTT